MVDSQIKMSSSLTEGKRLTTYTGNDLLDNALRNHSVKYPLYWLKTDLNWFGLVQIDTPGAPVMMSL
jgi:hypothetical protein